MLAALAVQVAEEVMRLGAPRIEADHTLVRGDGRIERSQLVIHRCEEIPGLGVSGVCDDQAFEQHLCRALVATPQQRLDVSESGRARDGDGGDARAARAGPG